MIFFEDSEILVMIDEEELHFLLARKLLTGEDFIQIDQKFKSALELSEHLRDGVSLSVALKILDENNVPFNSPMRYLGRNRY